MDDSQESKSESQILSLSLEILNMLVGLKSAWPAYLPSRFCQQRPLSYVRHLRCCASHHYKRLNGVSGALKLEESHSITLMSSSRRLPKGRWLKTTGRRPSEPLRINELRTFGLCSTSTSKRGQRALRRAVRSTGSKWQVFSNFIGEHSGGKNRTRFPSKAETKASEFR